MNFAGASSGIDTDPEHLSRLAAIRRKGETPGVYTIRTYPSRVLFDLANPKEADVRIEDIAHSLSMICRFGGHVPVFMSVAQHSVLVAHLARDLGLPDEHYGAALMHDAHEAYVGDMVSPAKRLVGRPYTNPADAIQAAIHRALGLPPLNAHAIGLIKRADEMALGLEQKAIERGDGVVYLPEAFEKQAGWRNWHPLTQPEALEHFLAAWDRWRESRELGELVA